MQKRLERYFDEGHRHEDLIVETLDALKPHLPIRSYDALGSLERFALNALIFRFSKLQDLLGAKIFRIYLEYNGFTVQERSFFELLKEIEKEGIVDIDTWNELRQLRNQVAHDYPAEIDEVIESINLFIDKTGTLLEIFHVLEAKYHAIART